MKKLIKPAVVLAFCGFLLAFSISDDILQKLGLDKEDANNNIYQQVLGMEDMYFRLPYMPSLKNVVTGDKVGAAKEMFDYVKGYCEGPEFAAAYAKKREAEKPKDEPNYSLDEESLKGIKNFIEEYEKVANDKKKPQAERDEAREAADKYKELLDPTPNKTKWEKKYPADPTKMIETRLKEYIDLVNTVDFNAQLAAPDKYGKRKFVNPDLEKKSRKWKSVYRAGKEVNTAVVAMAKDWLKAGVKSSAPGALTTENKTVTGKSQDNTQAKPEDKPQETKKGLQKPSLRSLKEKILSKQQ